MVCFCQDDLTNLDIVNGRCYNSSVPQNVTFGEQGLPFGINLGSGNSSTKRKGAAPGRQLRRRWHLSGGLMLSVVLGWAF